jgi:hypothetical protein
VSRNGVDESHLRCLCVLASLREHLIFTQRRKDAKRSEVTTFVMLRAAAATGHMDHSFPLRTNNSVSSSVRLVYSVVACRQSHGIHRTHGIKRNKRNAANSRPVHELSFFTVIHCTPR